MGNQPSFEQNTDFRDLKSNFTYLKKYTDSRFGEVKLIKENATGRTIFQKDYTSSTAKEFQAYITDIRDSSVLQHPNILRVYGYNSKKEDLFCADFFKLSLFFESFDTDLEQEISRRQHTKEYFNETELWFILDSLASACAYLQINNIPHRDIRPFNIFINSNRDYKLSATSLFRQNYNPAYFGNFEGLEDQNRYYSPEVLQHLSKTAEQRKTLSYDEHKSDVFSLGLSMIETGNLEKVNGVYDFKRFEINQSPIRDGLNKLRTRYSENLVRTIESLVDPTPENRLDFIKLDKELSLYRRDIREKARGPVPPSPIYEPPQTQDIMYERRASPVRPVRSGAPDLVDDLENRVREAVRRSEEVISRTSPSKRSNKNLDPFIQSYLKNENNMREQPLLSYIAPYLTSESKYTTTLTIEQPNYGRESQPINFGQSQIAEGPGEVVKRNAFIDVNQQGPEQTAQVGTPTYGQTSGTTPNYGGLSASAYLLQQQQQTQQPTTYGQTATYGQTSGTPTAAYGATTGALSGSQYLQQQQTQQPATYGQTSGTPTAAYGATTGGDQAGAYGATGTTNYGSYNYGTSAGTDYLKKSGALGNYGQTTTTTTYDQGTLGGQGTTGGYGTTATYTTTTYTTSYAGTGGQKDYAAEADDLTRRIEERLKQSQHQVNVQTY